MEIMFNPNAKLINCNTCGEITEEEITNGKKIKNCKKCRIKKRERTNRPLNARNNRQRVFIKAKRIYI